MLISSLYCEPSFATIDELPLKGLSLADRRPELAIDGGILDSGVDKLVEGLAQKLAFVKAADAQEGGIDPLNDPIGTADRHGVDRGGQGCA